MTPQPDLQPTLGGRLLFLRPLHSTDFETLYECASNPDVWAQHPELTRYRREIFQKFFDTAIASKGALAVIDQATQKMIGSSRFYNYEPPEITVGYTFLRKEYWGGTYNRELKTLMLAHAFRFATTVVFEIGKNNLRSRKAIDRIGAQLFKEKECGTHLIYKITESQFLGHLPEKLGRP